MRAGLARKSKLKRETSVLSRNPYNVLPLGGEGGPQPVLSSAGAGRVRGFLPIGPLSNKVGQDTRKRPLALEFQI